MLKVKQTLTCDICRNEIRSVTQIVPAGAQIPILERGPIGMREWHDVCRRCHSSVVKALEAVKALETAKAAE
jgi:hypothetical protein